MSRPRPAIVVAVLSALALIAGLAVIVSAGSGSSVASVGERPATTAADSTAVDSESRQSTDPDPAVNPLSTIPRTRSDATVLPIRDPGATPRQIRIPRLSIDAPVDEVGLIGDGKVEVPRDVSRTGWYRYSQVLESDEGSTVIVGHRDGVDQGAGAFYGLGELQLGDRIVVTTAGGDRVRYEVVARESFDKQIVPLDELFSSAGPHRLTLITCGGPFDATTLGYTDNVVVTAVPVDDVVAWGTR